MWMPACAASTMVADTVVAPSAPAAITVGRSRRDVLRTRAPLSARGRRTVKPGPGSLCDSLLYSIPLPLARQRSASPQAQAEQEAGAAAGASQPYDSQRCPPPASPKSRRCARQGRPHPTAIRRSCSAVRPTCGTPPRTAMVAGVAPCSLTTASTCGARRAPDGP